ncbi:hypothetical protein DB35_04940 [Streptomyces abyssalis]|uniref:Uncharacterized protein n=1 Tax=Streptomyces abyssalis TaxID=933944 RepID=A0A1E7JQG4_9ACTN|nr:hypothetical protein [Streptomyces abyssalis]OEU90531.1 hypothetical protein AN215_14015 [Streptomyces abyssalis]OEU95270.1 hypothetical protein DB35_04940 [Streptomyces abyssalis]
MAMRFPALLGLPVEAGLLDGYTIALTVERYFGRPSLWWHAWAPDGSYAGQTNNGRWLALLIAQHRQTTS